MAQTSQSQNRMLKMKKKRILDVHDFFPLISDLVAPAIHNTKKNGPNAV